MGWNLQSASRKAPVDLRSAVESITTGVGGIMCTSVETHLPRTVLVQGDYKKGRNLIAAEEEADLYDGRFDL